MNDPHPALGPLYAPVENIDEAFRELKRYGAVPDDYLDAVDHDTGARLLIARNLRGLRALKLMLNGMRKLNTEGRSRVTTCPELPVVDVGTASKTGTG